MGSVFPNPQKFSVYKLFTFQMNQNEIKRYEMNDKISLFLSFSYARISLRRIVEYINWNIYDILKPILNMSIQRWDLELYFCYVRICCVHCIRIPLCQFVCGFQRLMTLFDRIIKFKLIELAERQWVYFVAKYYIMVDKWLVKIENTNQSPLACTRICTSMKRDGV